MKRKILCAMLCVYMVLSLVPAVYAADHTIAAGGWNETIWAEISGITDEDVTAVSYCGTTSGQLAGEDLQYLVRDMSGGVRIDIPGVPAGTYTLSVTTASGTLSKNDIQVEAQDRSGYAHFGYTEGVGAYRDDGALKDDAIVLYVTEANKNMVSVTSKDGTTVTGIGNILNSRGRSSNGGSLVNTNQDILRKLAADGTPLVVRIIGTVTAPEGLTAYNSKDYGGSIGDNGFMARMQGAKDITIEGIGVGATIDGWGLHFICGGGDYARGWGKSFEVRNLSFYNVPEDCVGMEGEQDGQTLNAPVERCWIHHCAFYAPTIANPAESDKGGGDGACDFKRGQYFTNSYCYYEGYHKTNLVGGSDSNLQFHMTYHHNHWKNCESRAPLARQANIHMYNNILEGQRSYCMNPRANAYIFSEYNLFLNSKNPVRVKLGAVKSYQDAFQNCKGDNHATIVTDKTTPVDTNCRYTNFDTNEAISYIPTGDYLLHDSILVMQAVVLDQAGPQKQGTQAPDHTHSYTAKVTTEAACETEGVITYTCQCGDRYTEQIPAAGHALVSTDNAPTCTEDALIEIGCVNCDFRKTEILPATGHSYREDHCVYCGEKDPAALPQTQPTKPVTEPTTTPIAPTTETEKTTAAPTVPEATEPQQQQKNSGGKTVLTVVLAIAAVGFIVATIWELKKKR